MLLIGRMTRSMVHDFNNALASILGYADFLMMDLEKESEQHIFATNINKAARQMQILLRQLSVLTANNHTHMSQPLDISTSIQKIVENFYQTLPLIYQGSYHADNIQAVCPIPLPQLQILLTNLLLNAYESLPSQAGKISVSLTEENPLVKDISSPFYKDILPLNVATKNVLYLCVTDTGCGMDEDVLTHAFDPYFTTKTAETSHGIGLTIVSGIVNSLGGSISIHTAKEKGTSILIALPIIINSGLPFAQQPRCIVFIEDREMVRNAMVIALNRAGHTVHDFSNAPEALDFVRENIGSIDIIISDVNMPEMDGAEFMEQLQYDAPNLPIILLSGDENTLQSLQEKHTSQRIFFVAKPVHNESLLQIIQSAV